MDSVEETDEKTSAFIGFTMIVGRNLQAMERDLAHFFVAIARYKEINNPQKPQTETLHTLFGQVCS